MTSKRILFIFRILFYVTVLFFSAVFIVEFVFLPLPENYLGASNYEVFLQFPTVGKPSTGLTLSIILLLIAIAAIIWFFVKNLITDKRKNLKAIVVLIVLVLVFFISYLFAKNDAIEGITALKSKIIGAGIFVAGFSLFLSFLLIIFTEFKHLTK